MGGADEGHPVDPEQDQRNRAECDKYAHAAGQEPQQNGDNGDRAHLRCPLGGAVMGSIDQMAAAVRELGFALGAREFDEA